MQLGGEVGEEISLTQESSQPITLSPPRDPVQHNIDPFECDELSSEHSDSQSEDDAQHILTADLPCSEHIPAQEDGDLPFHMGVALNTLRDHGAVINWHGRTKITAATAEDHIMVPEYPKTALSGVLHFIRFQQPLLQALATDEEARAETVKLMSNIQFSTAQEGGVRLSKLRLLDGITPTETWHTPYICKGIKCCEHAEPFITTPRPSFDDVDITLLNDIRKRGSKLVEKVGISDEIKRRAESFFHAFMLEWKARNNKKGPCLDPHFGTVQCRDCIPVLIDWHGNILLGCPYKTQLEPWHYAMPIPTLVSQLDREYLTQLVLMGGSRIKKRTCTYIGHTASRRVICKFDHPTGPGKVVRLKCNVKFDIYIPKNMVRTPWVLLLARGQHTHHPPPPTKLPIQLADEVKNTLQQLDLTDMNARKFLLTPEFKRVTRLHPANTLDHIHRSLNVLDTVAALIRKAQLLKYPQGLDLQGVYREFEAEKTRPINEQWIRKIHHFDDEHFLIICCTYAQAKAFTEVQHIEMDLSFKMVNGSTNVFSITGFNETTKRINVYIYGFINIETREAYATMFLQLFSVLQDVSKKEVKFSPIHGQGIHTVTVDMCKKQAPGFGDYLHTLDPSKYWYEHLEHILIFCRVHVKRNLRKKTTDPIIIAEVDQIWDLESMDKVTEHMDRITSEYPQLTHWLNSKKRPWILAGLCKELSRIPFRAWINAQKHTGSTESSHHQDNTAVGRKRALLIAILRLKLHVVSLYTHQKVFEDEGIDHTIRNSSDTLRFQKQLRKKDKSYQEAAIARAIHPQKQWNPTNPCDTPVPYTGWILSVGSASSQYILGNETPPGGTPGPYSERGRSSSLGSAYAGQMLPPCRSQTPQSSRGKRAHQVQPSQESVGERTHAERLAYLHNTREKALQDTELLQARTSLLEAKKAQVIAQKALQSSELWHVENGNT